MTDQPSLELLRSRAEWYGAGCPGMEELSIYLTDPVEGIMHDAAHDLRAALDRIEGLTQNLNGLDADYGNLLREHENVSRELSHLRAENARQAQEIQRLREALLRACEDSASGDHAQAGGPEWPSERFRHGAAPPPAAGAEDIRSRARKLAQEMVLFGGLTGGQWDGLTALLVLFAESEIKVRLTALEEADAHLRQLAKEATNGWACYARTKREHDEIARLHREIDALPEAAIAPAEAERRAPPGEKEEER